VFCVHRLFLITTCCYCLNAELLVLHKGHSSLGFYTDEGKLITTAAVNQHPHEIAFSPDGRYAYTSDNGTMRIEQAGTGGNTVSIIDLKDRKKVGEISTGQFRRPHGIHMLKATGQLLVSTELPDQLLIIDPVKRAVVKTYPTGGKTAHMVVATPDGKYAFISNSVSSNVSAIELATGKITLIPTGARPEGSVISKDGKRLYVGNRDAAQVSVIDTAKLQVIQTIKASGGPVRIDLTPDGRYAVYGLLNEQGVEWIDTTTGKIAGHVDLKAALGQIVSLHLSHDGQTAYAANENMDLVYAVSIPRKQLIKTFSTPKGYAPDPVIPKPN
jgi:YVTN family beta-propeller protein